MKANASPELVASAVREVVAALTQHENPEKRFRKLDRLLRRADELRPAGREASNVVPFCNGRAAWRAAKALAEQREATVADLITSAVAAELTAMRGRGA